MIKVVAELMLLFYDIMLLIFHKQELKRGSLYSLNTDLVIKLIPLIMFLMIIIK